MLCCLSHLHLANVANGMSLRSVQHSMKSLSWDLDKVESCSVEESNNYGRPHCINELTRVELGPKHDLDESYKV